MEAGSYSESRSGSMKEVAPKGSMLASSILLMMELPAIEAARPARKPTQTHIRTQNIHTSVTPGWVEMSERYCPCFCSVISSISVCLSVFTRADDACVKDGEVLLAGGEGGNGEGAIGLGAAAHPSLRRRTGTLCSWTHRAETSYYFLGFLSTQNC